MDSKKFDHTHMRQDFDLKQPGHVSEGGNSPPRISEAVVHAEPSDRIETLLELTPAAAYKITMPEVFRRVHDRLKNGLDEAWKSTWGYDGDLVDTPDERWARLVSEMFVFNAYEGPGLNYGLNGKHMEKLGKSADAHKDLAIVERLDYFGEGRTDPVYAIVGACQHIANYLVLTRGYQVAALGRVGLGTGSQKGVPCFTGEYKGRWVDTSNGNIAALEAQLAKLGGPHLTPGSMFGFTGSVHIGGILRHEKGAAQYQPMDTGVLSGLGDVGTADHEAQTVASGATSNLVGVGVLDPDPPTEAWLSMLPTARPLGVAHFVVADVDNNVRYISRALPMHVGSQGYAITRYVWSLRCFPAKGRGFWIISIPAVGDVSLAMLMQGARDKPLKELCAGLAATTNGTVLKPVNVIVSTEGLPDQGHVDQGMAKTKDKKGQVQESWRGYATGAIVYRHKISDTENLWIRYRGPNQSFNPNSLFPKELLELKVASAKSFTALWKSMEIDEEYTCSDPSAADGAPVPALSANAEYFGGPKVAPKVSAQSPSNPQATP